MDQQTKKRTFFIYLRGFQDDRQNFPPVLLLNVTVHNDVLRLKVSGLAMERNILICGQLTNSVDQEKSADLVC